MFIAQSGDQVFTTQDYERERPSPIFCPSCRTKLVHIRETDKRRAHFRAPDRHTADCELFQLTSRTEQLEEQARADGAAIHRKTNQVIEVVIDPDPPSNERLDDHFVAGDNDKQVVFSPRQPGDESRDSVLQRGLAAILSILANQGPDGFAGVKIRLPEGDDRPIDEVLFSKRSTEYGLYWGRVWHEGDPKYKWRFIRMSPDGRPMLAKKMYGVVVAGDNFDRLRTRCELPMRAPFRGAYMIAMGQPDENGCISGPLSHFHLMFLP